MMKWILQWLVLVLVASVLSACGGGGGGSAPPPAADNSAPVAPDVSGEVVEDTPRTITLPGTDADGDTLTYSMVTAPAHGTVTVSGDQATYTPAANYNGADSFTYKVNDGEADSNVGTVSITVTAENDAPTADAGADQQVNENSSVSLSGSATDPDGDTPIYSWAQTDTSGLNVTLTGANTATPSFTAPAVTADTTLTFTLTVTDGHGGTATDTVNVRVKNVPNVPPTADAGADQTVNEKTAVNLTGSGTDSDGSIASYVWTQTDASGASVTLTGANTATPSFTAPTVSNSEGSKTLTFKLTVTDNEGATGEDSVNITVNAVNENPTADAGADQQVNENSSVNLSGSAIDPDGDTPVYNWAQTDSSGLSVTLTGANTATPSFTAPAVNADTTLTFTLTVTDGHGGTATDTVNVLVKNVPNVPPTADAGADQTVNEKTTVNLTGSGTDSDGSIASYVWTQTDASGASVTLTGANTATPSFTAPTVSNADGSKTLTFKLTVTDNEGAVGEDSVSITVNAVNENPTADAGTKQQVNENSSVSLSGSATDPDGDTPTYSWAQTDSSGVTATLTGANTATPSFTAPAVDADTTLTFTLTVNDGYGGTATDTVNVLVKDNPVAQPTPTGKLNDTGITRCGDYAYDASGNTVSGHSHSNSQDCNLLSDAEGDPIPPSQRAAGTGQDGYTGRDVTANDDSDGHAGFSFTKISSTGVELPVSATEWSCVKDNVTGLIWEVKTDDGGLHDKDDAYTWYEPDSGKNGGFAGYQKPSDYNSSYSDAICYGHTAGSAATYCNTKAYVDRVNTTDWCGANDWRMPTKEELRSIVSYDRYYPAIDTTWFPNTPSAWFWSASPHADYGYYAWLVYFYYGTDGYGGKDYGGYQVRLVRSGQ